MKIYLGVHNITERRTNRDVQMREIIDYKMHPDFNLRSLDNDIALIKLKEPVQIDGKLNLFVIRDQNS